MASNDNSIQAAEHAPAATAEELMVRKDLKVEEKEENQVENEKVTVEKWPGWPGYSVFRLIVPFVKVGAIIGRKGELVKKICNETGARIRIFDGPINTPDRIVLISAKEEQDMPLSPAMDAAIRVSKRVVGLLTHEGHPVSASVTAAVRASYFSIRLLVASSQALHLIGSKGSTIQSMQDVAGAIIRVLPDEELPFYVSSDESIVEIHGEVFNVLKGVETVIGHLRKYLVDRSIVPFFEKNYYALISKDGLFGTLAYKTQSSMNYPSTQQTGFGSDGSLSLYDQDHGLGVTHSTGLTPAAVPRVTEMAQTILQVPLAYAAAIIGADGTNISYIRRVSGAVVTVQETPGLPDEVTIQVHGSILEVEMAQDFIQEIIYSNVDAGVTGYSPSPETTYTPLVAGRYGSSSSGFGGYSGNRSELP